MARRFYLLFQHHTTDEFNAKAQEFLLNDGRHACSPAPALAWSLLNDRGHVCLAWAAPALLGGASSAAVRRSPCRPCT